LRVRLRRFRWRRVSSEEALVEPLFLVVNLPARLKNEQPNANAPQNDHGERYKQSLHGLHSKRFPMVERTILYLPMASTADN
jgi:hypothetical protein